MSPERAAPSLAHRAGVLAVLIVPALGAAVALWRALSLGLEPRALAWFGGLYLVSGLGITVGYHRMLSHRSFRAPVWLRALWLACGAMAIQGSPSDWAAGHLEHHARSDQDGDPHSPREGFWHAHMGWLFVHSADSARYARHLAQDPAVRAVDRSWWLWALLGLALPWALGGLDGLLWGGLVRIFAVHHATWAVNSVCHRFGRRPHATRDDSRNNALVALLTFGEGWHNNHHAFPSSALHGLRWWELDVSGLVIRALALAGLAREVKRPPPGRS